MLVSSTQWSARECSAHTFSSCDRQQCVALCLCACRHSTDPVPQLARESPWNLNHTRHSDGSQLPLTPRRRGQSASWLSCDKFSPLSSVLLPISSALCPHFPLWSVHRPFSVKWPVPPPPPPLLTASLLIKENASVMLNCHQTNTLYFYQYDKQRTHIFQSSSVLSWFFCIVGLLFFTTTQNTIFGNSSIPACDKTVSSDERKIVLAAHNVHSGDREKKRFSRYMHSIYSRHFSFCHKGLLN